MDIRGFAKQLVVKAEHAAEGLVEKGVNAGEAFVQKKIPQVGNLVATKVDGLTDRVTDAFEAKTDRWIDAGVEKLGGVKFIGGLVKAHEAKLEGFLDNVVAVDKLDDKVVDPLAFKGIDWAEQKASALTTKVADVVEAKVDGVVHKVADKLNDWLTPN